MYKTVRSKSKLHIHQICYWLHIVLWKICCVSELVKWFSPSVSFESLRPGGIYVSLNSVIVSSANGSSPVCCQAITWTIADFWPINDFGLTKIHIKNVVKKCWPFCWDIDVLPSTMNSLPPMPAVNASLSAAIRLHVELMVFPVGSMKYIDYLSTLCCGITSQYWCNIDCGGLNTSIHMGHDKLINTRCVDLWYYCMSRIQSNFWIKLNLPRILLLSHLKNDDMN